MSMRDSAWDSLVDELTERVYERLLPRIMHSGVVQQPFPQRPGASRTTGLVDGKELYTVEDVARMTSMSVNGIYTWIRTGKVQKKKLGRRVMIPRSEVERILAGGEE